MDPVTTIGVGSSAATFELVWALVEAAANLYEAASIAQEDWKKSQVEFPSEVISYPSLNITGPYCMLKTHSARTNMT